VVEYALRRLMQKPIRALETIDPSAPRAHPDATPAPATTDHVTAYPVTTDHPDADHLDAARADATHADAARADAEVGNAGSGGAGTEAGEAEPPLIIRLRPSAWALLRRVPLVLVRLILELIPVLGLALAGHVIAGSSLGGQTISQLIILAVVDAYALCIAILCVARMLLSPGAAGLRLFHLPDATALYLMRWTRCIVLLAIFGYAIGEVGLLLGLSEAAHDLLQKAIGLVLHLCLAVMVLQNRDAVRLWLRAPEARKGQPGIAAALRNRLAAIWHLIALFFLIAVWLVWAVEVPHGFAVLLNTSVLTAAVLIGARLTLLLLLGVSDRVMRPVDDGATAYRGIRLRLHRYHWTVAAVLRLIIYTLCTLGLLQLYGTNAFLWLMTSPLGLRILSATGTILLTIVLALGVWEAVNVSIQRHLDRLQRDSEMARSARLRTLLPLVRTALLITIVVVAGLMLLSEIGINIAPLLAGAGIIGVAIGFGSQKLVQDLITGIFLLLENAMQVGDWVTVSGLSGTVEALSVRTIRLRAGDGSVHLIPFSSVTSVTNVNRGLGNASVNVVVQYQEDTDRVCAQLQAIVADMRADPELSAKMLSDLQLWGVDKVDGAGVTIAGQVVCTDAGRWPVQREFNRRMKQRFQELGIKIYSPVQTISLSTASPITVPAEKREEHGHAEAAD